MASGGGFKRRIYELEASGFIQTFIPYGKKSMVQYYRVIDEYTMFYVLVLPTGMFVPII